MSKLEVEKFFIENLQERAHTKRELKEKFQIAFPEITGIKAIDRRCRRHLNRLVKLNLVSKVEGLRSGEDWYYWYIYPDFLQKDDEALREHSRQLIPGLAIIADIDLKANEKAQIRSSADLELLTRSAEMHLSTYREIYPALKRYRESNENVVSLGDRFEKEIIGRLRKNFELVSEVELNTRLWRAIEGQNPVIYDVSDQHDLNQIEDEPLRVGFNIVEILYRDLSKNGDYQIGLCKNYIIYDGELISKGKYMYRKIKDFIDTQRSDITICNLVNKIKNEKIVVNESYMKYRDEIHQLIMRIRSHEKLLGECPICPKVYTKEDHHDSIQ